MSLFIFYEETNFRDEIAKIAAALADATPVVYDLFGFPITRETTVSDFDGSKTLLVQYNFLIGTTTFIVYDPAISFDPEYEFYFVGEFDTLATLTIPNLSAYLTATEPDFISYNPNSVIEGFATRDEMLGQAQFFGGFGQDKIELETLDGSLGDAVVASLASGQQGNDILKAAVLNAVLDGGNGKDTLVAEFGTVSMTGGNGADDFIFDNGFWDIPGSAAQGAEGTSATITDFDAAEGDEIVFAMIDDDMGSGDAPQRQSLEDLYGAGTLDTLADFTLDGLSYTFDEVGGDATITRSGTDPSGRSYDETVVVDGVGLAEIDRSDVLLQDYDADTYEFF